MRICILTQPLHTNYGGLLQAYALQRVLREMGHEVVTENRSTKDFSPLRRVLRSEWVRKLLGLPRYWRPNEIAVIRRYTDQFIAQNIATIEPLRSSSHQRFDAYLVGSDQVWRKEYNERVEDYFLDFAPDSALKVAYAASFGVSYWQFGASQSRRLLRLARRFGAVSVRESSAANLCRTHLALDAQVVLDPVFLLTAQDYQMLEDQAEEVSEGVVSYMLDPSVAKAELLTNVTEQLKLPQRDLGQPLRSNCYEGVAAEQCTVPPPAQWLSGLRRADFVVTDSFHGVAFAILFNRPFVALANAERGVDRFSSLLSLFGLEERLVTSLDDLDFEKLCSPIDYTQVNQRLQTLREASLDWLKDAITKRG